MTRLNKLKLSVLILAIGTTLTLGTCAFLTIKNVYGDISDNLNKSNVIVKNKKVRVYRSQRDECHYQVIFEDQSISQELFKLNAAGDCSYEEGDIVMIRFINDNFADHQIDNLKHKWQAVYVSLGIGLVLLYSLVITYLEIKPKSERKNLFKYDL